MLSQRSLKLSLILFTQFFFLFSGSDLHYCFPADSFFSSISFNVFQIPYSVFFHLCVFLFWWFLYFLTLCYKANFSLDACILLLNSLITFTIITLNSFSGSLPISRSLSSSCVCLFSFFQYLFIWLHWLLVAGCRIFALHFTMQIPQLQHVNSQLWHVGSSSLIRD